MVNGIEIYLLYREEASVGTGYGRKYVVGAFSSREGANKWADENPIHADDAYIVSPITLVMDKLEEPDPVMSQLREVCRAWEVQITMEGGDPSTRKLRDPGEITEDLVTPYCPACNPLVPGSPPHVVGCPKTAGKKNPGCPICNFTGFVSKGEGPIKIEQPCECWREFR